ncbi:MAG: PAS domain-containing protein, partial [Armatimonadetes bacterium]|nr:PAS domain-containing protein [Armatimonadota bacterium]
MLEILPMLSDPHAATGLAVHPAIAGKETALLKALLSCTDYGILIARLATRQDILCNARFGELFGLDPQEVVSLTPELAREQVLPRIKHPEAFLEDLQYVYANPQLERTDELELMHPERVLRRHTCPLLDAEGEPIARVWSFLDLTPLKELQRQVERHAGELEERVNERTRQLQQAQKQLVEQEKLAGVGHLAITVAHQIRNILTPLTLELSARSSPDGEADDLSPILRQQIQRLTALTHQLLALSQPPKLEVRRLDLRAIWQNIVGILQALAEQNGCKLQTHLPPDPVWVAVNREQIEHIFVNLSINAMAAMAKTGGALTVEITHDGAMALAVFTDGGPGIREEIAAHLFEPFVSGRPTGTGLGLYSCRRIAQEHGG